MSKECPICHANVEDTATVCSVCGATLSTEVGWEDPVYWTDPAPTRADGYPSSAAKGLSVALAVFCFISSGISLLLLLMFTFIGGILGELGVEELAELLTVATLDFWPVFLLVVADAVFYVVFGILLLVKKSWKIALTITIYSSVWVVFEIIGGSFSGIPLLPVLGVLSTIWLRKAPETLEKYVD